MPRRHTARCTTTARSAATIYSFYPTKNLGGIGDGGAVVTDDAATSPRRVRLLRVHGMTEQYVHEAVSQNFRMSEIEAAWLRLALPRPADEQRAAPGDRSPRIEHAAPQLRWQATITRSRLPSVRASRRRPRPTIRAALDDRGVATAVHYPLAHHAAAGVPPPRRTLRAREAEAWAAECVTRAVLPGDDRRRGRAWSRALAVAEREP